MGLDAGTVAGYDAVVSISNEAINAQLVNLYCTLATPAVAGAPKFLIDHELHLHAKYASGATSKKGIDAYVCFPTITRNPTGATNAPDSQTARIAFKFRRGNDKEIVRRQKELDAAQQAAAPTGNNDQTTTTPSTSPTVHVSADSVYTYDKVIDDEHKEFVRIVINDWEMSWDVLVQQKDVGDVMSELVNPARSTNNPMALSTSVTDKLSKFSNSEVFKVSTIFCAMEYGRLVKTIQFKDKDGVVQNNSSEMLTFTTLLNSVLTTTPPSEQAKSTTPPATTVGSTTLGSQFVLGYTISQETADATAFSAASGQVTPPYFVPRGFNLSLSGKTDRTNGTLNFCLMTGRGLKPPDNKEEYPLRNPPFPDESANALKTTLFDTYGVKAALGSADGIMSFARDIVLGRWIKYNIAPPFRVDFNQIAKGLTTLVSDKMVNHKDQWRQGDNAFGNMSPANSSSGPQADNSYKYTASSPWSKRVVYYWHMNENTGDYENRFALKLQITNDLVISYKNVSTDGAATDDARYRVELTIESWLFYQMLEEGSLTGGDPNNDSRWSTEKTRRTWVNFKWIVILGTSGSNRGAFSIVDTKALHNDNNGRLVTNSEPPPENEPHKPGAWQDKAAEYSILQGLFGGDGSNTDAGIGGTISGYVTNVADVMAKAISKLEGNLKAAIILPAGDVFMFKGLQRSSDANLMSVITYATQTFGKVERMKSPQWSWAPEWVQPTAQADAGPVVTS